MNLIPVVRLVDEKGPAFTFEDFSEFTHSIFDIPLQQYAAAFLLKKTLPAVIKQETRQYNLRKFQAGRRSPHTQSFLDHATATA